MTVQLPRANAPSPFVMPLVLALLVVGGLAVPAAVAADPERVVESRIDRKDGEADAVEARREWFLSSRRAGAESDAERARLRAEAVDATRIELQRQAARRRAGSEDPDNLWTSMGPAPSGFGGWAFGTVTGRVSAITPDWDGGIVYVGTASGGLWRSDNDGVSWTQLMDEAGTMTVGAVAIDPNDSSVLWVGTGENVVSCESYFGIGLLRSADGGPDLGGCATAAATATLQDLATFADVDRRSARLEPPRHRRPPARLRHRRGSWAVCSPRTTPARPGPSD